MPMHMTVLPVLVTFSLGILSSMDAQQESRLSLEPVKAKNAEPPFRPGDRLDIQSDATVFSVVTRITILNVAHWPWVLVKSEQGESWLNFDHVVVAKSVAAAK